MHLTLSLLMGRASRGQEEYEMHGLGQILLSGQQLSVSKPASGSRYFLLLRCHALLSSPQKLDLAKRRMLFRLTQLE